MANPILKSISRTLGIQEEEIKPYPSSLVLLKDATLQMVRIQGEKKILAVGAEASIEEWEGQILEGQGLVTDFDSLGIAKLCPLSHSNRLVLNRLLPYTKPVSFGRKVPTFGVGDRLGLATPGHILAFREREAKPIFAQQSKRELSLTGRTYEQVLDDVCFSVFQEGYQGGFGADGDHLKQIADVEDALNCGYTMITLDCSEVIDKNAENLPLEEARAAYLSLSASYRRRMEARYLRNPFFIESEEFQFTEDELVRCALIYGKAIDFVEEVYQHHILKRDRPIDFELSIDETESITTSFGHLFVAMELRDRGVEITSLAPRFVGEFQKGIDYIGDLGLLEAEIGRHARIANHFGYKLSIHSGSDKFSAFPMIGRLTEGRFHLKTSGTNWLEAVGTIALCAPDLYRKMHQTALANFNEARQFYHVSADLTEVKPLTQVADADLIQYLGNNHSRQLLHITYGYQLSDPQLKEEIIRVLEEHEEVYRARLVDHIGRHLDELQVRKVE